LRYARTLSCGPPKVRGLQSRLAEEDGMNIRASATQAEIAAAKLAHLGRGFLGRREHHLERVIGNFVGEALNVPSGMRLPPELREELDARIDHTIYKLEAHVSREGARSARRAMSDTGLVKHVYALRAAQQHLRLK
jgi:hypothetical protein